MRLWTARGAGSNPTTWSTGCLYATSISQTDLPHSSWPKYILCYLLPLSLHKKATIGWISPRQWVKCMGLGHDKKGGGALVVIGWPRPASDVSTLIWLCPRVRAGNLMPSAPYPCRTAKDRQPQGIFIYFHYSYYFQGEGTDSIGLLNLEDARDYQPGYPAPYLAIYTYRKTLQSIRSGQRRDGPVPWVVWSVWVCPVAWRWWGWRACSS